jgi:hypothetical protein
MRSDDGGYGFYGNDTLSLTDASADAYRADLSVELGTSSPGARVA